MRSERGKHAHLKVRRGSMLIRGAHLIIIILANINLVSSSLYCGDTCVMILGNDTCVMIHAL